MWPEREQGNTGGNALLLMALLTILAFGGGGVVLLELVQHRDAWSVTLGSAALWEQLLLGVVAGVLIGGTAWAMIRRVGRAISGMSRAKHRPLAAATPIRRPV